MEYIVQYKSIISQEMSERKFRWEDVQAVKDFIDTLLLNNMSFSVTVKKVAA